MILTKEDTRRIHLDQLLLWRDSYEMRPLEIIKSIGFVQIDSIFVVARSQDLVLHSRNKSYQEEEVWKLLESNLLFEEFAHARSLISMELFPYYYRKMIARREQRPKWFNLLNNAEQIIESTLDLIRKEKEITTSDVIINEEHTKGRWSGMNKRIVDYLALRGYITVSRRDKFSTIFYQPIEEVIDIPAKDEIPNRLEVFWKEIDTNLNNLGLVPLHRLLHYTYSTRRFKYKDKTYTPSKLLKDALKDGKYETLTIDNTEYIFKSGELDRLTDIPKDEMNVSFLSPFDNCLWSRESLVDQFNFDYKMEIYVPKKDRQYGFYAMPILYGTEFVGRLDPKLDRNRNQMDFLGWYWEHNFSPDTVFWENLSRRIEQFLTFHNCDTYSLGNLEEPYKQEILNRISGFSYENA